MEDNKYYIPNIEEFYVGFEFEYRNSKAKYIKSNDFSYTLMEIDSDCINNLKSDLQNNQIRVKYLDKEDIEELEFKEWIPPYAMIAGWKTYINQNESFIINFKDNMVNIHYNNFIMGDNECIFKGRLKNKSELKKLLKQLGI